MGSTGLIIVIILCVFLSAFFSATETAYSCCNKIRLKSMAQNGNKGAARALKILDNYDSFLSTVLIGNNIVNIAASSIATIVFVRSMGEVGATWSTLIMTLLILVFAEVTPKSIAKEVAESFSISVSGVVRVLVIIFYPLNKLFEWWKLLINKIFHLEQKNSITEGEFLTMVDTAESEGGIDSKDSKLIHNVMEFNDLDVGEIFTPRVDVIAIPLNASKDEIYKVFSEHEFSRLPVYDENIDDIVGFLHQKDFMDSVYFGKSSMKDVLQPILHVAPTMKISTLLTTLQQRHSHMAVVTDEFGGTDGIVTMEDILEELVGEIYDEHDEEEKDIVRTGKNEYLAQCSCELEDFFDYFHLEPPEDSDSNTLGGWVLEKFEEIPKKGDHFNYANMTITVNETDSRKVQSIRIKVHTHEKHNDYEE